MTTRSSEVRPTLITVVEPEIRTRLDLFGEGRFTALHKGCVREAVHTSSAVRRRSVLVSTKYVHPADIPLIASLIRSSVNVVAIHSDSNTSAELQLGACGVRTLLDLRQATEWHRLRELVCDRLTETREKIRDGLAPGLNGASEETQRFFERLVSESPKIRTVQELAAIIAVLPTTLISRFYRSGLPSPKRYLAETRLLYAAALFEDRSRSVSAVANDLEYSSSQSFGRHLYGLVGLTPTQFRWRLDLQHAVHSYVIRLIAPHKLKFSSFRPY